MDISNCLLQRVLESLAPMPQQISGIRPVICAMELGWMTRKNRAETQEYSAQPRREGRLSDPELARSGLRQPHRKAA